MDASESDHIAYAAAGHGRMTTRQAKDPRGVAEAAGKMLSPRSDREARRVLVSLCDPTRFKIVRALRVTELAAGDIATVIQRSRSATSHHLRILREVSAVASRREGNVIQYNLADDLTADVLKAIQSAFDLLLPH
jgi:DNA-binding transcriptional ArsR family regulator